MPMLPLTPISCSFKYPAIDHSKAGTRASSCLSENSWQSWKHGLPKESPTLLSLQSGFWRWWSCTELPPVHSEIWATTALMPCLCQSVTLHVQDTQTRSASAAHQRNKTSEYLQQTQVLSWTFLQLCDSCNYSSVQVTLPPALRHPLLSWPQTAIVGTGSFSKAQSGHYQSPVLGMTPTQSSKYKYLIEKFNLILQNTDTTLPNVAK